VQGNSFGGLFAAHLAAADSRIKACVINGAPSRPSTPQFRTPREQLLAALGRSESEADAMLSLLAFDPVAQPIGCPLLVLQGGADPLATPAEQAAFLAAGEPSRTSQRLWPDGEHTIYNHADERDSEVAEWFSRSLALTSEGESRVD
jgi:alpha-beta hydrolase superfamily lysophospholipase